MSGSRRGFTLIEVMVVVLIIAALAGMVLPRVLNRADEARKDIARGEIAAIKTALDLFRLDFGRYPTEKEGLGALMSDPGQSGNWKGPYLQSAPQDPWKQDYRYKSPGVHNVGGVDIWSIGLDPDDGKDDVANWSE